MDSSLPSPRRSGRSLSRTTRESRRDYLVGICLLLVVVFLWTTSSFVTQDLFDYGWGKPFWLTYLSTSTFALYLLPYSVKWLVYRDKLEMEEGNRGRTREGYQPLTNDAPELTRPEVLDDPAFDAIGEPLPPLTVRETAKLAAWFCLLWFVANYTLTVSLGYTTVASATILSSMSGFFTLAIGRLFRVETLTLVKIIAVVASFGGVVLVSLADSSEIPIPDTAPAPGGVGAVDGGSARAPIIGDLLALLSALFYALYVILLKARVRQESRVNMQLFFGFVGLFNIILCLPIGLILHLARLERFEMPNTKPVVFMVLVSMGITLSSDYIYVLAMLKTTPLVVTIGLSLTIPLAVIGDFVLHKPVKVQVILGAIVVLLSFVLVGWEDAKDESKPDLLTGKPLDDENVGSASVRLEEEVPHGVHSGL